MSEVDEVQPGDGFQSPMTDVPETAWSAREILSWSQAAIQPALRSAIGALPPPLQQIAAYHFGWTGENGRPSRASGGKAVRPALTLLTAHATGGSTTVAIPAAIAIELAHNFSLLHDDVMDGDTSRRHRPTAWTVFGTGEAILVGDVLFALALSAVAGSGHPDAAEHAQLVNTAVIDMIHGQSSDLAFERRDNVTVDDYFAMVAGKTGALIACACVLGARSAGTPPEQVEHMRRFGEHLGIAFQCVDDILGIWGDPSVTGKPAHSDLRSRKKTLPILIALSSGTPAAAELTALFRREQALSRSDIDRAVHLIDVADGRIRCQAWADEHFEQAMRHLRQAAPTQRANGLETLAHLIAHRDH